MHPILTARRLLLAGLAAFVGAGAVTAQAPNDPPAAAQPQAKPVEVKLGKFGELLVPTGGLVRFKVPTPRNQPFKDVTTSNDLVVQVRPDPDPQYIQMVGLTPGITKLIITLADNSKGEYEVVVQPDYELLRRVIARAVPTASIEIIPGVGNSIIITGYVNKPEDAETVMQIARASVITSSTTVQTSGQATGIGVGTQPGLSPTAPAGGSIGTTQSQSISTSQTAIGTIINAIQIGGPQHVQIEVTFASVNRTKLRSRGADFSITGSQGSFISNILTQQNNIFVGIVPSGINVALLALKTEGLAKVLTEPKIVTQSGRPAILRSGGQQAVLSATTGGLGSVSVQLEEVGTTMQVLPIVYGNGKIYLEVAPSIRQVNNGLGIQTSAGFSPGFSEQSAQASVMLESGQTFAIGGLLETTTQSTATRVPVLGEIPYLSYMFSSNQSDERESELVILVTPRLVDALDCAQTPKRVPGRETRNLDDYEFYLEGLLEAPRGQRQVWNGRCYQAAYKCDPTYGLIPCKNNVCGSGNSGGTCGQTGGCTPSSLPAAPAPAVHPAPVTPIAPMPAPTPISNSTSAPSPLAEPIVMPQTSTVDVPTAPPAPVTPATPPEPPVDVPAPSGEK